MNKKQHFVTVEEPAKKQLDLLAKEIGLSRQLILSLLVYRFGKILGKQLNAERK